ncbi:MAG: hypothetical protein IPM25_03640 [Chloracidobacterium sp.]|nr:hypothetical protein [Chloracidobacterium sp.]
MIDQIFRLLKLALRPGGETVRGFGWFRSYKVVPRPNLNQKTNSRIAAPARSNNDVKSRTSRVFPTSV